jgi:hypothetical protein
MLSAEVLVRKAEVCLDEAKVSRLKSCFATI